MSRYENEADSKGQGRERFGRGYYDEEWWVEYLENELDPSMNEDLSRVLRSSLPDRRVYDSISGLREAVKSCDEVPMPEDGTYYDRLHDRIVAGIEEEAVDTEQILQPLRSPTLGRIAKALTTLLMSAALVFVAIRELHQASQPTSPTVAARGESAKAAKVARTEKGRAVRANEPTLLSYLSLEKLEELVFGTTDDPAKE